MTDRQTITVGINAGEMIAAQEWSTTRNKIDQHGALGIGDGFGVIAVQINGRDAVRTHVHEDAHGHVVIDVYDALSGEKLGIVDPDLYGVTPPRRGPQPKRERRFGREPFGKPRA